MSNFEGASRENPFGAHLPDETDFGGDHVVNEKARDELAGFDENHVSNLFDQNEDAAGEKYDLATGEPIDNTRLDNAQDALTVIDVNAGSKGSSREELLPPIEEEDDDAARWLRENGG